MRLVFGLVLIAGLAMAGFAVKMAMDYVGTYEAALAAERQKTNESIATTQIYIAKRPLAYGEAVTADDVVLVHYPTAILPEGHFDEARPVAADGAPPRVVLRAIERNEPLLAVKLSEPGGDAGLVSRLNPGERAFAIKVDVASGVSGFLRPGDLVDIYWTGRPQARDGGMPEGEVTRLIESTVRLIAIDQMANTETREVAIARTVTVAATPLQVAALAQAQSTGRMSLSLVGLDDATAETGPIEFNERDLLGIVEETQTALAPVPRQPLEQQCSIRTRRGGDVIDTPIPCTN
ncbi:Flp pilus assembly protein CpaB [Citreimonas salinaria]|uniref:Pilus assembly protein CpaB n=1 Tax=Citreimonas salinaria TaxID=321339 RepID=A0A1H3MJS8_9RHOB|nr:Flp pilus assembly protein CpaB [Citreimonas salinaria]SDY76389.1 pilus assembly protein CpaB [Citreimonas salinaria]